MYVDIVNCAGYSHIAKVFFLPLPFQVFRSDSRFIAISVERKCHEAKMGRTKCYLH